MNMWDEGLFRWFGRMEENLYSTLRHPLLPARCVYGGVWVFAVLSVSLPLIVTESASIPEASRICRARRRKFTDKIGDPSLDPAFYFNTLALVVSLVCGHLWLFHSPHNLKHPLLDKTLGSFCILQLFANMLKVCLQTRICTSHSLLSGFLYAFYLWVIYALCIFGTNVLMHRYILAKTRVLTSMLVEPPVEMMAWLESAFLWQCRLWYAFVPIWAVLRLFERKFAYPIGICFVISFTAFTAIFSIMATKVFLRPVQDALDEESGGNSLEYQKLVQTKWLTLIGASLGIGSSMLFYANLMLYLWIWFVKEVELPEMPWHDHFHPDSLYNPFVATNSVDSILNDIGMVLISGLLVQKLGPRLPSSSSCNALKRPFLSSNESVSHELDAYIKSKPSFPPSVEPNSYDVDVERPLVNLFHESMSITNGSGGRPAFNNDSSFLWSSSASSVSSSLQPKGTNASLRNSSFAFDLRTALSNGSHPAE